MLMAKPTEPGSLAPLLDAAHPAFGSRKGLQSGLVPKLQTVTFRYKRGPRQECICHDDVYRLCSAFIRNACDSIEARQPHRKIRIGEMPVHKMKFVVVNNMAPRNPSVCAECSRPLERGYLHDLSTSRRYCGIGCYPQWMVVSGLVGSTAPTNPFEFAIAWPKLTVDVASALFDSALSDHGG
jgi:hypothetical protein